MTVLYDNHRVILAPMAGITDQCFRQLCIEQGAQLTYTEMVSAKGLQYANKKTANLISLAPGEKQVVVQLFGHEPDIMAHQAQWLEKTLGEALFAVDVNMGCPARKIARKGDGSALMDNPKLAADIAHHVVEAVNVPVTVKFRRGTLAGKDTSLEFAQRLEDAGISAVCVHPRFAEQFYRGQADWSVIAKIKDALEIPVVGSGDIKNGMDAVRMMQQTGCDAVMIGRAAMGNPWVFADVVNMLESGCSAKPPTREERIMLAKRHVRLFAEAQNRAASSNAEIYKSHNYHQKSQQYESCQSAQSRNNLSAMRRHAMCYVSAMPKAAEVRACLSRASTIEDYDAAFDKIL